MITLSFSFILACYLPTRHIRCYRSAGQFLTIDRSEPNLVLWHPKPKVISVMIRLSSQSLFDFTWKIRLTFQNDEIITFIISLITFKSAKYLHYDLHLKTKNSIWWKWHIKMNKLIFFDILLRNFTSQKYPKIFHSLKVRESIVL